MASNKRSTGDLTSTRFDDAQWRASLRRKILAWYRQHARDLPWRRTRDPYHVWVSEVMLQQTQVATVVPYFNRFTKKFPTIARLAAASEQSVLRLWEGLGYYRRARQLHKAARLIVEQHGGQFPRDEDAVRALPGIGRYTAGAILSIAFNDRRPILEANTIRLFSRLAEFRGNPSDRNGQDFLWQIAAASLPRRNVGDFNQALMELGSEVCTPREPNCRSCPLCAMCPTFELGLQSEIPIAAKRPDYEDLNEAAIIVPRRGKVLIRRCGETERWAGMWDFPRFEIRSESTAGKCREVMKQMRTMTGLSVEVNAIWKTVKHGVTRFRITLDCFKADSVSGRIKTNGSELKWLAPRDLSDYPLSVTGRKISAMLMK